MRRLLDMNEAYIVLRRTIRLENNTVCPMNTIYVSKSYEKILRTIQRQNGRETGYFRNEILKNKPNIIGLKRFSNFANLVKAEPDSVWVLESAFDPIKNALSVTDEQALDIMFANESNKTDFRVKLMSKEFMIQEWNNSIL